MQAVYTAKHGLQAQQQRMDIIASNIANVSTTGYKSQSTGFKDALYTQMIDPADTGSTANLKQGSGVLVSSTHRNFTGGNPNKTDVGLDLLIEGDGFFTVQNGNGEALYTRNGAFAVSREDSGRYLVTGDGYYVLDAEGNRILLPDDLSDMTFGQDGSINFGGGPALSLGIVTFTNKDGLQAAGGSCYAATEASGEAIDSSATVRQGYLESSNVDTSMELTKLIRTRRAYSLAGMVLTTWDEMENATNSIR